MLFDEIHQPNHAGLIAVLLAYAKLCGALLFCFQNSVQLLHSGSQGLFAKHVDAATECRDNHFGMQIVRGADVNGIGLFFFEQFYVIGVNRNVAKLKFFNSFLCVLGNDIAKSANLVARTDDGVDVVARNRAATDDGNTESFHNVFLVFL